MHEVILRIPSSYLFMPSISSFTGKLLKKNNISEREASLFSYAVEEVLTNIIRHSYGGRQDQWIEIKWRIFPEKIEVEFRFGGKPVEVPEEKFDIHRKVKERKKGGFGLEIIRKASDKVEFGREGEENWWRIEKKLKG